MVSRSNGSGHEPSQDSEQDASETGEKENDSLSMDLELAGNIDVRLADIYAEAPPLLDARMITDLIANVSHELRTPLHGILSFAHFGSRNVDNVSKEKLRKYFEEIAGSGETLLSIINDLLDLSKLQAGKMQFMLKPNSLEDMLQRVTSELSLLFVEHQVSVSVSCVGEVKAVVFDISRMLQLMRNLLANALRYSSVNGHIEIRLDYSCHEAVYIHVLDEGCGIPEGEEEAIFEPFVQSKLRLGVSSTGLGLPICRQIIEQGHQGKIRAVNRTRGGAEFIVMLPTNLKVTLPDDQPD